MWEKPIGIFDSGLGGLTALKEIAKIMPNEDIVYFGDTGRVPYGDRDKKTLILYAKQNLSFLMSQDVKIVLAACGTISSLDNFSSLEKNIPLMGVIDSACVSAVKTTKTGKIGVIGTSSTIKSNAYKTGIRSLMPNATVYQRDCPMLAPLIETENIDCFGDKLVKYVKGYLSEFKDLTMDTMILGCTHYPLIEDLIREIVGENVNLINPGREASISLFKFLKERNRLSTKKSQGEIKIFVSGEKEKFAKTASSFLQRNIEKNLKSINLSGWSQ